MNSQKIYYIGGSPCAGKSSVAAILSERYNLDYLRLDDRLLDHIHAAAPQTALASIRDVNSDELWLIPPNAQARRTIHAYLEEFPLHRPDIENQHEKGLIVEGAGLLPCLLGEDVQVIYMMPTPVFQHHHYSQRAWVPDVLRGCSDPDQAFRNWMRRDEIFSRWVRAQAGIYGMKTLIIDGRLDLENTAELVAAHFSLG